MLSCSLYPGKPDSEFVELIDKEGDEFKANEKIVPSLDTSWEFTIDGHAYDKTIRATDYCVLCNLSSSDRTTRCAMCTCINCSVLA